MRKIIRRLLIALGSLFVIFFILALGPFLYFQAGCTTDLVKNKDDVESANNVLPPQATEAKQNVERYIRDEESTYLTFPEWYIVYSADEYGVFLKDNRPSKFPYFASIGQFWRTYGCVYEITKEQYPFNGGRHLMLVVIGTSYSGEYAIKGVYENTIGRITELLSRGRKTDEDVYAQKVAEEYGTFLHTIPWYEFPFRQKLQGLWQETDLWGPRMIRKWERKISLSAEYAVKAAYGALIEKATRATYVPAPLEIYALVNTIPTPVLAEHPEVKVIQQVEDVQLIELPRYEAFTNIVTTLARRDTQLIEIAGNDDILITVLAPGDWSGEIEAGNILFTMPVLTESGQQRVGMRVPVQSIHSVINTLEKEGVKTEHLYDY